MSDIVQKLWGFCHTLRHDGVDYGDYIEQLTYLLFLKMADERGTKVPKDCDWESLKAKSGTQLTDHYADILRKLREAGGLLADIFAQATPRFNNPVNLKRVIAMIDEEDWSAMDVDVKGAAFEGLLEKAASEGKKGAGQYFTPRPLIQAIVSVMKPDPRGRTDFRICDPACGTGGFLVCSYEWLVSRGVSGGVFDRADARRIKSQTFIGQDLVPRPRRLALMNLFLHGVEPHIYLGDTVYEPDRGERYDVVLTNPPFGTKGANQAPDRDDFTIETSNKQLNFVQHVVTTLKPGGRAAMVLPDNCLFEGKAGEVFELLMQDCALHTVLRLPRGTFTPYSQGVKANVIFFQKGRPTDAVWIFDARSNVPGITKKDRPLTAQHFAEFEKCYGKDPNGLSKRTDTGEAGRFRKFHISEIKERGYKLDVTWLKDDSLEDADELPEPQDLAAEAITELEAVVDDLREIVGLEEDQDSVSAVRDELPNGWAIVDFFDFCVLQRGYDLPLVQVKPGPYPVLSSAGIVAHHAEFKARGPGVVTGRSGSIGRVFFVESDYWPHNTALFVKDFKGNDPKYVYLFLRGFDITKYSASTAVPTLNRNNLRDVVIKVPPLAEQRRIVAKLEKLLRRVESCRSRLETVVGVLPQRPQALIDRLSQSILAKAFRGNLVAQDPSDEPASVMLERVGNLGRAESKK